METALSRTRAERTLLDRVFQRIERWWQPPRRAIPTRAGLFALGAPIVLGIAAVNGSNNLLFMLLGGVLGAIVLSGILSERNIRGVDVDVRPVSPVYAGEPARLEVTFLRRRGAREDQAAYSLHLIERPRRSLLAYFHKGTRPDLLDVTLPILEGSSGSKLGARTFQARGPASLGFTELMTRYPFGLLTKARDADVEVDVLVRPRRIAAPLALVDPLGLASEGDDSLRRGFGLELYGLREREDRDAIHRVHALRSLALGREVVIETAGIERPIARLGVLNAEGADPLAFERTLELAQALLRAWDERGFAVGLTTLGASFEPGASSVAGLEDGLARLGLERAAATLHQAGVLWLVPRGASAQGLSAVVRVARDGSFALEGIARGSRAEGRA